MLVLKRKPGTAFFVFDENGKQIAHVKILGFHRDQVRIGITAPKSVSFIRDDAKRTSVIR